MPTHHIIVSGKVQGVFYRATAKEIALTAGLGGWIKNTDNGDVEIVVTGDLLQLSDFESWCKIGPRQAEVKTITVNLVPYRSFDSFKILQ